MVKTIENLKNIKHMFTLLLSVTIFLSLVSNASAALKLDSIQFDPAIIAAGDEIDIVMQYHHDIIAEEESRIGNENYKFKVMIEPDDTLTTKYVTIQDAEGDNLHGSIFSGDYYNKRFRVKINSDAPAGNYEFKLIGKWYLNGQPEQAEQYVRFKMPVKKEGIILDITTLETVPSEVRPGDNYVKIVTNIENVGEKDAKSVEVQLNLPDSLEASYTNNNRLWIGRVNAGEQKQVIFFVDVEDSASDKVYDLDYSLDYMDLDDNSYQKSLVIPFLVKPRPYIEVIKSEGTGLAGSSSKLYVTVKNTGAESAEAVDVRILKENSQPFTLDVRSDYIGELEPGEEGLAIFDINVNSDAEFKDYNFKLLIRSKGDSDEGDDNIYTYNRRAEYTVEGKAPNMFIYFGLGAFIIAIIVFIVLRRNKK
ncbi:MAG: hypothetical protein U9R08_06530 [Nanoarchaeota archaeon]|nr:hypothetical protein [Nanoarchaeota archaeon]